MQANARVGRADALAGSLPPGGYDPVDRPGIDSRAVAEDDDCRLDLVTERRQAATERGAGAELPVGAADDPFGRLHVVRAEHYNHVGDLPALPHSPDDRLDQHGLLRRAVASGRSGGQHDGCDHSSFMCKTTMRRVGRSVARLPSRPILSTTFNPFVALPRIAYSGVSCASGAVTTKNWLAEAAGGARRLGPRLRHRDDAFRVARVLRRHVLHGVTRAALARPRRVAALNHEARDDAVEDRAVEEPLAHERRERRRDARRVADVEPECKAAHVRLHVDGVRCLRAQQRKRHVAPGRRALRRRRRSRVRLATPAARGERDDDGDQRQPRSTRHNDVTFAT